ncbi:MAG: 5-formyltetrahydrofolate cyclo-ligase [Myxococcota bacterium]
MGPRGPRPSFSIDSPLTRVGKDLSATKRRLRDEMGLRRRLVKPSDASRAAELAARALVGLDSVKRAGRIGMYAALPDEMPTRVLFDAVVALGTVALFPRTRTDGSLEFCVVDRWEELSSGAYGVLEPAPARRAEGFDSDDLVVVPGVAFDASGNRLGRGKAYYDRTFPPDSASSPVLIGYGYEFQVLDRVPHGNRDRRLDAIVTERAVRRCQ